MVAPGWFDLAVVACWHGLDTAGKARLLDAYLGRQAPDSSALLDRWMNIYAGTEALWMLAKAGPDGLPVCERTRVARAIELLELAPNRPA